MAAADISFAGVRFRGDRGPDRFGTIAPAVPATRLGTTRGLPIPRVAKAADAKNTDSIKWEGRS